MRKAVRAIVIKDQQLLMMYRNKFGDEYYTLPGGNIEIGETPEIALARELMEETMITFSDEKLIAIEHAGDPYGDQFIYLCNYVAGEPQLHPDAEEQAINRLGRNLYRPCWVSLNDLRGLPVLSEKLKQFILGSITQGWPEAAVEITTN